MLFASSSPATRRYLNDHAALADLAVARWFQMQCLFALVVITDDQLDSAAPAVEGGRLLDAFGVGLQGLSLIHI